MTDSSQTNIFHLAKAYPDVAELCNALYERELVNLASSQISDSDILKRKLNGLSYHVRNAAQFLLEGYSPLGVDIHNGTWKAKQNNKCPISASDESKQLAKNSQWFSKHAKYGYVVCVYVNELGIEHIELDSMDMLDKSNARVHLNKFGWFSYEGVYLDTMKLHHDLQMIKPNKKILSAACCGHTWKSKIKTRPRALSLRELLLSTNINWTSFK